MYQDVKSGCGKTVSIAQPDDSAYIAIPAGENATEFTLVDDTVLEAGKYIISGELKVDSVIDFNKYTFNSGLAADGNLRTLTVTAGDDTAAGAVDYENWSETEIVLNLTAPIAASELVFTLNDAIELGVKNLSIEYAGVTDNAQAFIDATNAIGENPAESGAAVSAAADAYAALTAGEQAMVSEYYAVFAEAKAAYNAALGIDWTSANGKVILAVDDVNGDEETNDFVHVYNRNVGDNGVVRYRNDNVQVTAGEKYQISFRVRNSVPYVNAPASGFFHTTIRAGMRHNDIWSATFWNTNQPNPDTWTEVTAEYTNAHTGYLSIFFYYGGNAKSVASFDVDDLSVRKIVDGVVSDEELAIDSEFLYDEYEGTGWEVWSIYPGATKVMIDTESVYYTAGVNTDKGTNGIIYNNDETLERGNNLITGKFRLSNVDYEKITFVGTSSTIENNFNKAELSATVGDTALLTDSGANAAEITTEWTTASFVIPASITSADGLEFTLTDAINGDALSLDFKDIEITSLGDDYDPDAEAAYIVETMIAELPSLDVITVHDKEAVDAARAA